MPGIDRHMMLDTLGAQLNLSAIVDGILGNWNRHFRCNWCNLGNLTILSFPNDTGAHVKPLQPIWLSCCLSSTMPSLPVGSSIYILFASK